MNHRSAPYLITLVFLASLLAANSAAATEVWIVTDSRTPVTGRQVATRVIEIDAPEHIESELAVQLSADPKQAAAQITALLESGGQALQERMREAYQGVVDAWSLGIARLPAVVVDRRFVIYGETAADKALARIVKYREAQP
ncbi:TPA: TIGR03757 family integrating conjugative element protein [Pseudomonas aeruginosa]